jgi:tetratricopeptide (TPR) repeat protein
LKMRTYRHPLIPFSLLAAVAMLRAQDVAPVGVILAAQSSFVQLPGIETQFEAKPGMQLRPGYRLRSANGTVRFAFCPGNTQQTLQPGRELIVPQLSLPQTAGLFADVQKLPFCELPSTPSRDPAVRGIGLPPSEPAAVPKADILDATRRAIALDQEGNHSAAAQEYQKLAADYPEAVWTRGVSVAPSNRASVDLEGKTFALLIGISEYPQESPLKSLQFAHSDAQSFAEFLRSPKGGAVPDEQIKLLLNGQATRDGIDSAVKNFVSRAAGKQNTLILFVAAHADFLVTEKDPASGAILHREPYIVTSDVYGQDVKSTGYPMAEFQTLIAEQTLQFGRVIVYADICHAGYIRDAPSERGLEPAVKQVFSNRQGNVGVMLAAEANRFAYEADEFGRHGAFTYTVLEGLNGGAAFQNSKVITFADLFRFVVNGLGELTNNTQSPDKFVNDDQMAVLDDVTRNPGITLPKATRLSEAVTRRRRGANQPGGQQAASGTRSLADSEFARLAQADPLAAIPLYNRMASDPAVSEDSRRQTAEILRVALEEHGQQILIRYLHGEQIPQTKPTFELGARYFEEALRLPQATAFDESRMWFCKGRALVFDREESHYQEAVRLLERSILLDPDHSYAYNALGIAYLEQVRQHPEYYPRAVAAFHDALRFAPAWAYPMHNLALAWSEQGNVAAAVDTYRLAMRLAPQYSYLPYNLALLNQRMNRLDDADQLYHLALREAEENRQSGLVPPVTPWREHADILNGIGAVAAARHKYAPAQDYYEHALQDDPELVAAKYNLANLLSRNGPSSRAVDLWRSNIAAAPQEPASRLALAAYFEKNGDHAGAIREYEGVVQVAPQHIGARRELAKLYASDGRWQDAYDQLKEARTLSPEHPEIAEEFGDAAAKVGRPAEASEAYRQSDRLFNARNDHKRVEGKLRAIGRN